MDEQRCCLSNCNRWNLAVSRSDSKVDFSTSDRDGFDRTRADHRFCSIDDYFGWDWRSSDRVVRTFVLEKHLARVFFVDRFHIPINWIACHLDRTRDTCLQPSHIDTFGDWVLFDSRVREKQSKVANHTSVQKLFVLSSICTLAKARNRAVFHELN